MLTRKSVLTGLAMTMAQAISAPAMAADAIFTNWLGRAIGGYDPVAYFTEGKPVEGSGDFTAEWNGATWRFASAKNRDMFVAAPEKYAPQYGGYCAYAVSQGYTASIVPEAWHITNGRLYLNYSLGVRKSWLEDRDNYIATADKNWPGVLQ